MSDLDKFYEKEVPDPQATAFFDWSSLAEEIKNDRSDSGDKAKAITQIEGSALMSSVEIYRESLGKKPLYRQETWVRVQETLQSCVLSALQAYGHFDYQGTGYLLKKHPIFTDDTHLECQVKNKETDKCAILVIDLLDPSFEILMWRGEKQVGVA